MTSIFANLVKLFIFVLFLSSCRSAVSQSFGTSFHIALPKRPASTTDTSFWVDSYINELGNVVDYSNSPYQSPGRSAYHLLVRAGDQDSRIRVKFRIGTGWGFIKDLSDPSSIVDNPLDEWMWIAAGTTRVVAIMPEHADYFDTINPNIQYPDRYNLRVDIPTDLPGTIDGANAANDTPAAEDAVSGKALVVETHPSGGPVAITIAAVKNHLWFPYESSISIDGSSTSEFRHDWVMPSFEYSVGRDLCHVLPTESLGSRYVVSPSTPGRRAEGNFGVYVVATQDSTPLSLTRPPAMDFDYWVTVLNSLGYAGDPADTVSFPLNQGDVLFLSDYADRAEDYSCNDATTNPCTSTRFDETSGPSTYSGLGLDAGGAPIAVYTVEHSVFTEIERNTGTGIPIHNGEGHSSSDFPLESFTLDQAIPFKSSGFHYIVPLTSPYITTGHNVRVIAYDDDTSVVVERISYGDVTRVLGNIYWESTAENNVLDIEPVSINYLDTYDSTHAGTVHLAHPIETDEVLAIQSTGGRISVVFSPRGDKLNGYTTSSASASDRDVDPHGTEPCAADHDYVGSYMVSAPAVSRYGTECILSVSNTYDMLYHSNDLALWESYCSAGTPPPENLLQVQSTLVRNYITVVAKQEVTDNVRIEYPGYTNECDPLSDIEIKTRSIDDFKFDYDAMVTISDHLDNECNDDWSEKLYTASRLIVDWAPCPGPGNYKWCVVQIPLATRKPSSDNSLPVEEARRDPQATTFRVYVDNLASVDPAAGDNLLAAYLTGFTLRQGGVPGGPTGYGLSGVPFNSTVQPVVIADTLLQNDITDFRNTSQIGIFELLDPDSQLPTAQWKLETAEDLPNVDEEVSVSYTLRVDDLAPSTLRQLSQGTSLTIPDQSITRTRGADYLPVLADPWGLEIATEEQYPQNVTAVATATLYPTPVTHREVFDSKIEFTDPSSHILTHVTVDEDNSSDDTVPPVPNSVRLLEENQLLDLFYEEGSIALVADAGRPVEWKDIKLILGDAIDADGNAYTSDTAETGVSVSVRSANTLVDLQNKRPDPDTQVLIAVNLETSTDIVFGDIPDLNIPVAQFLEVELTLHAGQSNVYSPTVETVYVSHRPAALELAINIEEPSSDPLVPGAVVSDLGSFSLSDAELAAPILTQEATFDTGSIPSGAYIARATIRDGLNGDQLATATTPFEITEEVPQTLLGNVAIKPSALHTGDGAVIASVVNNPNNQTTLTGVDVTISIKDHNGTDIVTPNGPYSDGIPYSYSVSDLSPGVEDIRPVQFVATDNLVAGDYIVHQEIEIQSLNNLIVSNTAPFTVVSSVEELAGISGMISVDYSPVGPNGEDPGINASITNTGNVDLTNAQVRFLFPHPAGSPNTDPVYPAHEYIYDIAGTFSIGQTISNISMPLGSIYSSSDDPNTGIVAEIGKSYPIELSATSTEHAIAAASLGEDQWVALDVNAFLVRSGPNQVSARRYIPIMLEPYETDIASSGLGINSRGEVVGTSTDSESYERASFWSGSREAHDTHEDILAELGLTGSLYSTSRSLNINKDGYLVGQLDYRNLDIHDENSEILYTKSFIGFAQDMDSNPTTPPTFSIEELLPSTLNPNTTNAYVTDISDEDIPSAVGYEIAALSSSGSAGSLASGDPGLIGSGSPSGSNTSGEITPGSGVTSSSTTTGGTALQGPSGSPSAATTLIPNAITWLNAHSNPGRATLADLSALDLNLVQGSHFWAINSDGNIVGDWREKSVGFHGLLHNGDEASDGGRYLNDHTSFRGIGNAGRIVGWSGKEASQEAFQIRPNGTVNGLIPSNGLTHRYAYAINGNGEAVGSAGDGVSQEATAWASGTYHDPYLSLTAEPRNPWTILEMRDINDSGQMVGTAKIPSILLGKGVPFNSVDIAIPEPLDVGSFFADSEGSGQSKLNALSTGYFAFSNTDPIAGEIGINESFGGELNGTSEQLRASEIFAEVFYASDPAGITITPVIDQGFGLRTVCAVRISQIDADPVAEPIRWAVEAVQNSVPLFQEHDNASFGYWSNWISQNDTPPIGNGEDYRQPFYIDFVNQTEYSWMATEPFVICVLPNSTEDDFVNVATNNGQDDHTHYRQNLMNAPAPWYPAPAVPNLNASSRPPLFSMSSVNPDFKEHMLTFNGSRMEGSVENTMTLFTCELISRNAENGNGDGSDRDFNDLIFHFEPALVTQSKTQNRAVILDPVQFDISLLDRLRLWSRSDVGVIPVHGSTSSESAVSRWWDFGTWDHSFGVMGSPTKETSGGYQEHPGIRLDGVDDSLVAVDIRYTDAAQSDGGYDLDLGDFVGDATMLLAIDLPSLGLADIPLFSTDKQVVRDGALEPSADRARIGLYLDSNGDLVFQTKLKNGSTLQAVTLGNSYGASLTANTVIIGLQIENDTVTAVINDETEAFPGNGDLGGTVSPVWTDITIGQNIQSDYGAFVVREVLMFDRALDGDELLGVTDYLMERYSITP